MEKGSARQEWRNTDAHWVTRPRKVLLRALEHVRSSVCCYQFSKSACDCKYGADGVGERTGCPELREVAALLKVLSEDEFADMQQRVWQKQQAERPDSFWPWCHLCERCLEDCKEHTDPNQLCSVSIRIDKIALGQCDCCGRTRVRLVGAATEAGMKMLRNVMLERARQCGIAMRSAQTALESWAAGVEEMSPQEVCETSVRAGIHHADGTLTEAYGGAPLELPEEVRRKHQEAREYVRSMTPEEAREFLVDGGFIHRDGSLTARYGGQKE
jgi:hypothetical protein